MSQQVPKVTHSGWVRSPIDRFILARLEEKGLSPARRWESGRSCGGRLTI